MKDPAALTTKCSQIEFQSPPNPHWPPSGGICRLVYCWILTGAAGNPNVQATVLKFPETMEWFPQGWVYNCSLDSHGAHLSRSRAISISFSKNRATKNLFRILPSHEYLAQCSHVASSSWMLVVLSLSVSSLSNTKGWLESAFLIAFFFFKVYFI